MAALLPEFDPSVHLRRRTRVLERLGDGVLVLPAAPPAVRSRDTGYPYRPDSELHWLTGVAEPDAVAVLRGGDEGGRLVLFVRPRDADAERWTGPRLGPEMARERFGADEAWSIGELEARLPALLDGASSVGFRLGEARAGEAQVLEALGRARSRGARHGIGPRSVVDPGEFLDDLRLRKDPWEVERIRAAVGLTVDAFRSVAPGLRAGVGEWVIQGRLDGAFRAGGGEGPAYETIVGSGPNACVLHYVEASRRLAEGDLVLVDAGASVGWYAADLTRTFPVDGRFTSDARAVYEVVDAARRAALARVRPGAALEDVHTAAVDVLRQGLVELGVLDVAELEDPFAHRPWYPHQTSHWLGLDVHDVGDYSREGDSRILEEGMVLTVEPGLYFPSGAGEGRAARFQGMGVRIEDDVLVTAEGADVLTAGMPTDPDEIAALVQG